MPELLVVRGNPDEESLAALVAVLLGYAAAAKPAGSPVRSPWAGEPWRQGPGAWRRSALPH
jgi:hypothetical protein